MTNNHDVIRKSNRRDTVSNAAYSKLIQELFDLDEKIMGIWVIDGIKEVAVSVRKGFPIPDRETMTSLFAQAQLMVQIPRTRENLYGRFEMVLVRHQHIDAILLHKSEDEIVLIGCLRSSSLGQFIEKIPSIFSKYS